jgi:hypothetical protein
MKINADNKDLKGYYANMMQATHSQEEFCLDFFNVFPPSPILLSRVVVSPGHLKRMIKALQDNLASYEKSFGQISEAKEPEKRIGFTNEA